MKKGIVMTALFALSAALGSTPIGFAESTAASGALLLAVETFARNERVIPLSYEHGGYICTHVKPPEIILRNISGKAVTVKRASLVGKSGGREIARFTVHEDRIGKLMFAQNKQLNKLMSAPDDAGMVDQLKRLHGEPAIMEAGYNEGNVLPPSAYACLGLAEALFFFYEGTAVVDGLEIVVEAEAEGGAASSVVYGLPYSSYACRGEYRFPIKGPSVVGSVPFGHSHRFANGGEFAIDIVDIRRDDSGAFSTSRVPSPMVILGSDKVSDYHIFGREVRAIAKGKVLEISDRYPDEVAANPREPFSKRNERLKRMLIEKGASSDSIAGGNYVLIDHGNGEYARYCHLREEIPVKAGDLVEQGKVIGYVGNSGNSTEPHLHLELLDSPDVNAANGLPIVFANLDLARALDSPFFGKKNSFLFSEFIFVISD